MVNALYAFNMFPNCIRIIILLFIIFILFHIITLPPNITDVYVCNRSYIK